ncbi:BTB/POZ domain-containing protein 16 [Rhinatrema bivittatum]|uniref:BTB/POZ domain-containing protein 16 n=1 Tax=Rhinatrema bivittatum TaxID=194408 RepID=UPI00112788C0|nr:BTB/POZ domain-containing protein 16 [Rhinatrema bivittatum]
MEEESFGGGLAARKKQELAPGREAKLQRRRRPSRMEEDPGDGGLWATGKELRSDLQAAEGGGLAARKKQERHQVAKPSSSGDGGGGGGHLAAEEGKQRPPGCRRGSAGSLVSLSEESNSDLLSLPSLKQEKSMSLPCLVPSECSNISLDQPLPKRSISWHNNPAPEDMFSYHSQNVTDGMEPEVALDCLGVIWELHRPYLVKSSILAELFRRAVQEEKARDPEKDAQDRRGQGDSRKERTWRLPASLETFSFAQGGQRSFRQKKTKKINISLDVQDSMVTRAGFAIALRNLYNNKSEVDMQDVLGVLASAAVLQFPALFQHCLCIMKSGVCSSNIGSLYEAGLKYKQEALKEACEQWLAVNLVPKLKSQIYLGQIPEELMQKVLMSPRLFTFSEYHLFRTILYWVYLQENPLCQILPTHSSILTFFNSFSKTCSFLESEVGQKYMSVFQCLRLHGITDSRQLEEIQQINVLPLKWLVRILSNHYQALAQPHGLGYDSIYKATAKAEGLTGARQRLKRNKAEAEN